MDIKHELLGCTQNLSCRGLKHADHVKRLYPRVQFGSQTECLGVGGDSGVGEGVGVFGSEVATNERAGHDCPGNLNIPCTGWRDCGEVGLPAKKQVHCGRSDPVKELPPLLGTVESRTRMLSTNTSFVGP